MKPKSILRLFLAAACSMLAVYSANASTWDGSESNLWSNALNWDAAPTLTGDNLIFSGTLNQTNTNDAGVTTITSLTLANAGWDISLGNSISSLGGITATGNSTLRGNFTVLSFGSNTFTLNGAAGTTTLTIADKLTFSRANNTATLTVNGAGNTLVLGSFEVGASGGSKTINGTANVTVNGAVTDTLSAGVSFIWAGNGTLTLKGTNTYDANSVFSSGTVDLGGSGTTGSLASANLTLGATVFNYTRTGNTTQSFTTTTLAGPATTTIPGGAKINVAAGNTLNLGTLTRGARGTIEFGTTGTITTTSSNNANGILGGWATIGGNWAVANGGSSAITGYTGSYSLTNDVTIQNSGAAYAGKMISVNSSQSPDAVITPSTLNFQTAGAYTLTLATGNNTVEGIRVTTDVGNNASIITGGTLTAGTADGALNIIQNNTATLTIGSIIANNGTASSLVKSGAGELIVTGNITSTGGITIHGGTLRLGDGTTVGTISNQTIVNNGHLILDRGNNDLNAPSLSITCTRSVTLNMSSSKGWTASSGSNFSGGFTQNGGNIYGIVAGTLNAFGTGTATINSVGTSGWRFSNANNTTTTINNEMVWNAAAMNLYTQNNGTTNNAILSWERGITLGTNVTLTQTYAASGSSSNISHIFNGNIGQTGGTRSLSFSGGNTTTGPTYTLNGTNTYTGNTYTGNTTTSNAASTLIIGGSGSLNSGNYAGTISAAGALKYSSSTNQIFSGSVSAASLTKDTSSTSKLTLSNASNTVSGNTIVTTGTLYVTGTLTTSAVIVGADGTVGSNGANGSIVGGLNIQTGGNLDLTGATLGSNSTGILTLSGGELTLANLTFQDLVGWNWQNAASGTYKLINGTFDITWGDTAYLSEQTAYDFGNGRSGYFTEGSLAVVIIPEPATLLLGSLGVILFLRRRRN